MTRQYAPQPDRRRESPTQVDPLEELRRRRAERARQEEELQASQRAIEEMQAEAEGMNQALQQEIQGLLSSNPEEFVIRFLQTEGQ